MEGDYTHNWEGDYTHNRINACNGNSSPTTLWDEGKKIYGSSFEIVKFTKPDPFAVERRLDEMPSSLYGAGLPICSIQF